LAARFNYGGIKDMRTEIRAELLKMSDAKYQKFSASLIPVSGRGQMIGVRLPALREYARSLAKKDWREELAYKEEIYFEETMLYGMILGYACKDIQELFLYLKEYIPRIQNWSVCDSVCSGLKLTEKYLEETWEFLQSYLYSGEEFPTRFGFIMLLDHFVKIGDGNRKISRMRRVSLADLENMEEEGPFLNRIFHTLDRELTEGYYAQMAAAWLIAEMFVVYPSRTKRALENLHLDSFTKKKAIQKIRESRIPDDEVKDLLKKTI